MRLSAITGIHLVLGFQPAHASKCGLAVADVMSRPPIAARADNKVADAACLMLKHKVHRIPIVDASAKVVGIVTRTDIFTALALDTGSADILTS
jgi:CBS domain-containing protein